MSRLRTRYFLKDQSGVCLCVCVCLSVRGLVSAQALRTSHSFHSSREVRAGHSEGASQALSASAAESGRAPRRWGAGTARSRRGGQPAGPGVPALCPCSSIIRREFLGRGLGQLPGARGGEAQASAWDPCLQHSPQRDRAHLEGTASHCPAYRSLRAWGGRQDATKPSAARLQSPGLPSPPWTRLRRRSHKTVPVVLLRTNTAFSKFLKKRRP